MSRPRSASTDPNYLRALERTAKWKLKHCHEAAFKAKQAACRRAWYLRKRDTAEYHEKHGKWDALRDRSDEHRKAMERYRLNPERVSARQAVHWALHTGKLVRPEQCQQCGVTPPKTSNGRSRLHAHHDDYQAKLDVRWLCSLCHGKAHRVLQ